MITVLTLYYFIFILFPTFLFISIQKILIFYLLTGNILIILLNYFCFYFIIYFFYYRKILFYMLKTFIGLNVKLILIS
jgi:hypothetical protein